MKYVTGLFLLLTSFQIFSGQKFAHHNLEFQDLECLKELNLTANFVVDSFDSYNFLEEGNSRLKEFVACSWKKSKYLNEDNSLNTNEIKTWLKRDLLKTLRKKGLTVDELVQPCSNVTGKDPGDIAIKAYNCMNKHLLGFN